MMKEIERKFLVDTAKLPPLPKPKVIKQGYIPRDNRATVRARITDDKAYLTLKSSTSGLTRSEFEYEIPVGDAELIMEELCSKPLIEKKRYLIEHEGHVWELDIFDGDNKGLIVAEIELESEEEAFVKPSWITEEVSFEPKYRNASLMYYPFKAWKS